jgi:hypothetical protein
MVLHWDNPLVLHHSGLVHGNQWGIYFTFEEDRFSELENQLSESRRDHLVMTIANWTIHYKWTF